jgi:Fur family transcriptional regulator, ferric uptake regulator
MTMAAATLRTARHHAQAPLPADGDDALADAQVARRLRSCGLRMTHHRQAVAQALRTAGTAPVTADEMHRRIQQAGSAVGLASVYRVLHEFERAGIVARRVLPSRVTAFSLDDGSPPVSRVCSRCGATAELVDSEVDALLRGLAAHHGVPAASVQLTLTTDCLGCAERGAASPTGAPAIIPSTPLSAAPSNAVCTEPARR